MSKTKIACFDLRGVLVKHGNETGQILLMDELLAGLIRKGWKTYVLSTYPQSEIKKIIKSAGIKSVKKFVSCTDKEVAIVRILDEEKAEEALFVDDKPVHLNNVKNLKDERIRVIGFLGSRKYEPAISAECLRNNIELALSPVDLCETLNVGLNGDPCRKMEVEDLIFLLPGLDHPLSSLAGETANFDHRAIFAALRDNGFINKDDILRNLGWITCRECFLKTIIEIVAASKGVEIGKIVTGEGKYKDYIEGLRMSGLKQSLEEDFKHAFEKVREGIEQIGRDAEKCRPVGRSIDLDRIEWAQREIGGNLECMKARGKHKNRPGFELS